MSVSTAAIPALIYTGNGSTVTPYTISFPFLEVGHVLAAVSSDGEEDAVPLDPGDYTVTRLADGSGGSLVTTAAVTSPATITIWRLTPLTQPTEFQTAGPFPSKSAETMGDRLLMQIQEAAQRIDALEGVDSAVIVPEGGSGIEDTQTWANAAARAAALPARAGQVGVQLDNTSVWRALSTDVGDWGETGRWQKEYFPFGIEGDAVPAVEGKTLTYLSEDTAIKSIFWMIGGSDPDSYTISVHAGDVLLLTFNPIGGNLQGTDATEIPNTMIPAGTIISLTVENPSTSPGGIDLVIVLNCARF